MKATQALDKAKVNLMTFQGTSFIQTIIYNLVHKFDDSVPTAKTDGISVTYNPEFFLSLNAKERLSLVCHEAWHVALDHIFRSKHLKTPQDHILYNMAGDYVINLMIASTGLPIPDDWLLDNAYEGLSTEEVYKLLKQQNPDMEFEGIGEDIDTPKSDEESEVVKSKLTEILVKAVNQAALTNSRSSIPNSILVKIDDLINPKLNWTELLLQFLTSQSKNDYSWKRPNKRYAPKHYLPYAYSESIEHLTIAIDTSGSITKEQIQSILSEIDFINRSVKPTSMTILDCDTEIHNIHEVDNYTDILSLNFNGRGGTSVEPVLEYCTNTDTTVLVYFTDLYVEVPTTEPDYPILWIVYDNKAIAPIGKTVHINLEEL
jgi:predicted metal-dependent peptidase